MEERGEREHQRCVWRDDGLIAALRAFVFVLLLVYCLVSFLAHETLDEVRRGREMCLPVRTYSALGGGFYNVVQRLTRSSFQNPSAEYLKKTSTAQLLYIITRSCEVEIK